MVTVRVRTGVGPADVVGTVLGVSGDTLTLRRRDGRIEHLPLRTIVAGRRVPPSPAQRISVAELQTVAARGWRALDEHRIGDWLLRASGGFTGRANSTLATGDPGIPVADAVEAVGRWYDERALPPQAQLPDRESTAGLVTVLDDLGWTASPPSSVMSAEITHVLRALAPSDVDTRLDDSPDDAWLSAYRQEGGVLPPAAREILVNHPTVVFASVRDDAGCLAVARATVDGRWAGLFAVEVEPGHRQRGLGRAVCAAALRWAGRRGARHAYLQVQSANKPALALFTGLGFSHHHGYVYRVGNVDR